MDRLKSLVEFLEASSTARTLLKKFLPLYRYGEIKILPFEPSEAPSASGSAFVYDGVQKALYLDFERPSAVLALFFIHEVIHCLDPHYLKTHRESQRRFEQLRKRGEQVLSQAHLVPRDLQEIESLKTAAESFDHQRVYATEREAYRLQHLITLELFEAYPGYRDELLRHSEWSPVLVGLVTDLEIIERYRLNPKYL